MDWGADPGGVPGPGRPAPDELLEAARTAVAALCADDVMCLDAEALAVRIAGVESLLAMLGAHQVDCVAAVEARGDARSAGFRSTQSWLRVAVRLAPGAAKGLVALARRIDERVATAEALAAGRISVSHAKVLAQAMEELAPCFDDPAEVDKLEAELVDLAERVDPLRLADACRRLRIQVAPDRAVEDDWVAFQRRDLSVSRSFDRLGVVNGILDPLGAETVMSAIHSFAAPSGDGDDRTPGQRRADALTEICRRVMTVSDTPTVAGERPHVNVIVPIDVLGDRRRVGEPALDQTPGELAWAGPVSGELVRRIACDAAIHRIITDGASQPLDVGRSTRVVPAGLRKALLIRDRRCRYPGCDVPGVWCDAHHLTHWAHGGPTALSNLVLLCGYHHSRLHLTGEWINLRPDGTVELVADEHPDHHDGDHTDRGP